jgi:uncharacterized membrane protein YhaH (DUF805 family)
MENVQQPQQQMPPQVPPQSQQSQQSQQTQQAQQSQQFQQPQMPPQPQFVPEAPAMSFGDAIKTCFNKYADFSGRATRAEYWWWVLLFVVLLLITSNWPVLSGLISLALFIPSLAVAWRRLHDIGRAGGWFFLSFIPLIGDIILLVWYCTKSEPHDNRFGPYLG